MKVGRKSIAMSVMWLGMPLLSARAEVRYLEDIALGAEWVEVSSPVGVVVTSTTEVTRAQWFALMGEGLQADRRCPSDDCPATNTTPLSVMVFANRLSDLEGLDRCYEIVGGQGDPKVGRLSMAEAVSIHWDCSGYRLPTHEEWGALIATEPYSRQGVPESWLDRVGWVTTESGEREMRPVARKWPSYAGLYDLIGNAAELGVLPQQYVGVATLERSILPANPVMLGCSVGERPENCFWPNSLGPVFLDRHAWLVGFRLVRAY
jgi:formylglycine-generating enzyme required for sulfatase activity